MASIEKHKDPDKNRRILFKRSESYSYEITDDYEDGMMDRQRSYSLPFVELSKNEKFKRTDDQTKEKLGCDARLQSDRKLLGIIANLVHVMFGIAITQLGIVGAWYKSHMNFAEDQLRYILYICILFIIYGSYGIILTAKSLEGMRAHITVYRLIASLSILASLFIIINGVRIVISDTYKSNQMVIIAFDSILLGLAAAEIPAAMMSTYITTYPPYIMHNSLSCPDLVADNGKTKADIQQAKNSASWRCIFSVLLNISHIVLGLCIIELGAVGMVYRRFMNIDNTGPFSVVFVSVSFVTAGVLGIYNHITGRQSRPCSYSLYTCASLMAIGGATVVLSLISIKMSSTQYYSGIEAILTFDAMIWSMCSIELGVATTAVILIVSPVLITKFGKFKSGDNSRLRVKQHGNE